MKSSVRVIGIIALAGVVVAPVCAQQSRWGAADEATVQMLKASEKVWLDSSCSAQPALRNVIADDFEGTAPSGRRYGKAQALSTDPQHLDHDCRLGDIKVHFFGDAMAVVYGSESSLRVNNDKAMKHCLIWTDTWLKRSGVWQIVAAQDTLVKCT